MVFILTGGWMDKTERHKCFSSDVGETDIEAALLNLMAEETESANGEWVGLSGEEPVMRLEGARLESWPLFGWNADVCAAKINN